MQRFFIWHAVLLFFLVLCSFGTVNAFTDELNSANTVELLGQTVVISETSEREAQGVIVVLQEPSIIEQKNVLEEKARINEDRLRGMSTYNPVRYVLSPFLLRERDVPKQLEKHTSVLEEEHRATKSKVLDRLRKTERSSLTGNAIKEYGELNVVDEFETVFNGLVLNISLEEAQGLKEVDGVKSIYLNQKVRATLMDSVPLIGAPNVWTMQDATGQNITGKGIRIGIIDTGVDYTHPDLGASVINNKAQFTQITSTPLQLNSIFIGGLPDQLISIEKDMIIYISNCQLHFYDLKTKNVSSVFAGDSYCPTLVNSYKNKIVYVTSNPSGDEGGIYVYDSLLKTHTKIRNASNSLGLAQSFTLSDKYLAYTYFINSNNVNATLVLYDLSNNREIEVARGWVDSQHIWNDLLVYVDHGSSSYQYYYLYNITSQQKRAIPAPNKGPLLDFRENKILYSKFNPTDERRWKDFYVYDINSNTYFILATDKDTATNDTSAVRSLNVGSIGYIMDGRLEENYVYFTDIGVYKKVYVYDFNVNKTVILNPYSLAGDLDTLGSTLCVVEKSLLVSCHNYNSSNNYTLSDPAFNSKVIGGYDFVNEDTVPLDDQGHGTHVAATAAGNGILKGVAPNAQIVAYKVLDSQGYGSSSDIIAAIERSADPDRNRNFSDHLDIISLSLGGPGSPDDPMSRAIDNVVNLGVVAVIAGGNSGPNEQTIGSPGTARKAITVGAVNKQLQLAYFSSRGPVIWENAEGNEQILIKPDLVAPGVDICAAQYDFAWSDKECIDDEHTAISGTSMATPHVAGAVALIKQAHPNWTAQEIKDVLKNTATDLGIDIAAQGFGMINVSNAIKSDIRSTIAELNIKNNYISTTKDITGTAKGLDFQKYEVYYKPKKEDNWNLMCTKTDVVTNDVLCNQFDTSVLTDGEYEIKLIVYTTYDQSNLDYSLFYVDHALKEGWPFFERGEEPYPQSGFLATPSIADIDKDGVQDIIYHSVAREYVFDGNGNAKAGWPTPRHTPSYFTNGQIPSAAVADIDGDGNVEIISTIGDYYAYKNNPLDYSYCFNVYEHNGVIKSGWPLGCKLTQPFTGGDHAHYPPVISDLDGDGRLEVIGLSESWQGRPTKLQVFNSDGTYFMNWPYSFPGPDASHGGYTLLSHSTLAVGDINNDSTKEIVAILYNQTNQRNYLFIWNYDGSLQLDYPIELNLSFYPYWSEGGAILVDIDGDGSKEIGFTEPNGNCYINNGKIVYVHLNGSIARNWPASFNDQFFGPTLSVGDIDKDGKVETVFGTTGSCTGNANSYSVYVIKNDGTVMNGWPQELQGEGVHSQATMGDVDGDGYADVLVSTTEGNVYAWNKIGILIRGFPKKMFGYSTSGVAIGDVDGDGKVEIVSSTAKKIYVWDLDATYNKSNMPWPQFQHDAQHTGCYDCNVSKVNTTHPPDTEEICIDQDGFDISIASEVIDNETVYRDTCIDGKNVREYICESIPSELRKRVESVVKECVYGCNEGACVSQGANDRVCADNEPENDLNLRGDVVHRGTVYSDKCEENGLSVRQYLCDGAKLANYVKRCSSGSTCINGACVA